MLTASNPFHHEHTCPRPQVGVVLVNWNGWKNTVECLESLLRSDYPDFSVVVCDNDSVDGSVERVIAWAEGRLVDKTGLNPRLTHLSTPLASKPMHVQVLTKMQAESSHPKCRAPKLTVIQTGENLGFAGGNNVGIRFLLSATECEFVWLLNNDSVVDPCAMTALVDKSVSDDDLAICGSKILFYEHPDLVQTLGGSKFNAWTARTRHLGELSPAGESVDESEIEAEMDYVEGASMLVSRSFIQRVGLMSEDYFLYFEELDWARRAGSLRLGYASNSRVYHKVGGSIGTGRTAAGRSLKAEYYSTRSRILFTRKFHKKRLPIVILAILASHLQRLVLHRRWKNAAIMLRGLVDGLAQDSRPK